MSQGKGFRMKTALLSWLWQFVLWRSACVAFVRWCPWEAASTWVFYHSGVGHALRELFTRQGDYELAAQCARELRRIEASL
jgi:hypothetical protein